ncbi:MAG: hypothetical protein M3O46_19885 [Myxococcota bacterium]|nr:hypothetical protein [Myxococcota bacterium]
MDVSVSGTLNAAQSVGSAPDATDLILAQLSKISKDGGTLANAATAEIYGAPEVRTAINKGAEIIRDAKPVIALAQLALSGKDPDPMALVSGMSGVVGMANPLAGAVVFAMGSIMVGLTSAANGLFVSLGLQHVLPTNESVVGGIVVGRMPTPRPPVVNDAGTDVSFDPLWMHWDTIVATEHEGGNVYNFHGMQAILLQTDLSTAHRPVADPVMWRILEVVAPKWPENYALPVPHYPNPQNDFERFFYPMLKKTIEHWYNANPYMDPRDLLGMAVKAWNQLHTAGDKRVYSPAEGKSDSVVSFLLSGAADCKGAAQRGLDVTVNLGPMVASPVAAHAAVVNRMAVRTGPMATAVRSTIAAISRAAVVTPAPSKLPAPVEKILPAPIDKRPAHPSQWSIGETIVACGAVGGVAALVLSRD